MDNADAQLRLDRPLRIVETVSSLHCGGMENFVIRISRMLKERGHQVSILALDDGLLTESARDQGVEVLALGPWGRPARLLRGLAFIARHRPDVIHAHNATSLHFAAAGKHLTRARLIFTDHGVFIMRKPWKWEIAAVDQMVAVSQQTAIDHRNSYGSSGPFRVIHNGIDFIQAHSSREEIRRSLNLPEGLTGAVVARLEPVKNHESLLHALSLLKDSAPALNLVIIGDGSEREKLEMLVRELRLEPARIQFLRFRSDVNILLPAMDFFVLPSRDEGMPLALLEAMSHGVPVVAAAVGGIPEVITDQEHGLLVPSGNPEALADALRRLVKDAGLRARLGAAGRRRVEQAFSFERTTDGYEDLYYSALRGSKAGSRVTAGFWM